MIRVFVGYDAREAVAYHVLGHSILARCSEPVSVAPLVLGNLPLRRPWDVNQSTAFSFTRFLVPWLCDFRGWAVFMDCDMLVRDDLAKLWALRDERYSVQVVKCGHDPVETEKFLGMPQGRYPKKNWSSVMLFNCARCSDLTPGYVDRAPGLDLHQFRWLGHDGLIGGLPRGWNHLVDWDPPGEASNYHFTGGGPWFGKYAGCSYSALWREERDRAFGLGSGARQDIAQGAQKIDDRSPVHG